MTTPSLYKVKKSLLSRTVRVFRLGYKRALTILASKILGKYSYRIFGIPSGIRTLFPKSQELKFSKLSEIPRKKPHTLDSKVFWRFNLTFPELSNDGVLITSGIATKEGANLTIEGKLVTSYLQLIDGQKPHQSDVFKFSSKRFFPKIKICDEPIISLVTPRQGGFYHWMFEILPRLQLAKDARYADKKLFISTNIAFQKQSLDLLGFGKEKIINADEYDAVKCSKLIIPSVPCLSDHAPLWTCHFLRENYLPLLSESKTCFERVYISRGRATRRRIINEKEVLDVLKPYHFECLYLEDLDFLDQIRVFKQAKCIIAPHGAGLSHIVFSNPGTILLELFSKSYVHTCYWHICNAMNIDYYYLLGEGPQFPDYFDPKDDPDFSVNLEELRTCLDKMEL